MTDQPTSSAALPRITDALPPWDPNKPPLCRECRKHLSDGPDGYCEVCR